jgi:hypothetical protein
MTKFWKRLTGRSLLNLIIAVSALCISYEGMSQGIMGAVTVAPAFGVSLLLSSDLS